MQQGSSFSLNGDKRQISNSLEQENFNLKLRIYHLEERLSQKYPGDISELVRFNAELSSQLDMKNEAVQQRDLLLVKARNVIESLQNDIEYLKASNGIKSDSDRNIGQEELRRSNLTIHQLSSKLQESEEKLKSTEDELSAVKSHMNDVSNQLALRSKEFESIREKVSNYDLIFGANIALKSSIQKLEKQLYDSQESYSSLKEKLSSCLLKLQSSEDNIVHLEKELDDSRTELKKFTQLYSSVCDRMQATETSERNKQLMILELERKVNDSTKTISTLQEDLSAFSKREAALVNELHKWKSLSQSQHEDKENLQQLHQQSFDKVRNSAEAYSDTLNKLSNVINNLVLCLHHLQVPSIPLHVSNTNESELTYNDDEKPPRFDANDARRADLIVTWIERKLQRITKIRSCLKATVLQAEEHLTKKLKKLEHMINNQEKNFQNIGKYLAKHCQPTTSKKSLSLLEEQLCAIDRELDNGLQLHS